MLYDFDENKYCTGSCTLDGIKLSLVVGAEIKLNSDDLVKVYRATE